MTGNELVVLDIDGCIKPSEVRKTDLKLLDQLQTYIDDNVDVPVILLTGRPSQYALGIFQDLNLWSEDIHPPSIVEYGCQFISHRDESVEGLHPDLDEEALRKGRRLSEEMVRGSEQWIEPGKEYMTSIKTDGSVKNLYRQVTAKFEEENMLDKVKITHSQSAVDILPSNVDKWSGLKVVLDRHNIDPENVVGIGDSYGDYKWLKKIGHGYTPSNGENKLLEENRINNLDNSVTKGTLEMFKNHF